LEQIRQDYKDGLITVKGLIFYSVIIFAAESPNNRLRIRDEGAFCRTIGVDWHIFRQVKVRLIKECRIHHGMFSDQRMIPGDDALLGGSSSQTAAAADSTGQKPRPKGTGGASTN
jgi:hypothetical protein